MLTVLATATTGATPLDTWWRMFIAVAGLLIGGVCLRVAWSALVRRDWENLTAVLSFGLVIVAPATSSLVRFDVPLPKPFAVLYTLGLIAALTALWFRVRISAPWLAFLARLNPRRKAPGDRPDPR